MGSIQSRYRAKAREILSNFTEHDPHKRLIAMIIIISTVIILFVIRLFYIQVVMGDEYLQAAQEQQFGKVVIPAKRGEILTENSKTGEINKLATNTSLDLVYIDPQEIPDKKMVAKALAPILFDEEDFSACKEDFKLCPSGGIQFNADQVLLDKTKDVTDILLKDTRTKEQLISAYENDLLEKISKEKVDYSPLKYGATDEEMKKIKDLGIAGVEVVEKTKLIYADPTHVDQSKIRVHAKTLASLIHEESSYIEKLLKQREVRYVPLKRKLSPEASEAIWKLKEESYKNNIESPFVSVQKGKATTKEHSVPHYFKGVVLVPEHWRYYPEKEVASTVIGYVDHEGIGRYGIEEKFDESLKGQDGIFWSQNDVHGDQLVFDASKMQEVRDGDSIILTIDRVIQTKVEEALKSGVERFNADNGTVVIMEPYSGAVIAMANYPNFDPNNFGEVYEMRKTTPADWKSSLKYNWKVYPTQPVFIKGENDEYVQVNYEFLENEQKKIQEAKDRKVRGEKDIDLTTGEEKEIEIPEVTEKYVYKNRFGLGAYMNRAVMSLYEPGSVFKPMAMAVGLDAGEVTPTTSYNETGPIEIDTGTGHKQYIRTALHIYRGWQTMTNAIEYSSNIGMAFMAKKLGKSLFYSYIKDFGFGEYTYIDLAGEQKGYIEFWKKWNEAKLYTTSFGQGVSVTPIQMTSALSSLANGGVLMQPQIIKSHIKVDGTRIDIKPKVIRRVISEKASEQITGMLVSSTMNGAAKMGKVKGYKLAGKTGTAQIACSDSYRCHIGYYEAGDGTTVTSYGGYGPVDHPKFVMLVKFERPRLGGNTWGENTAAPIFKEIAEFLYQYYDIQPDE